MGQAEEPDHPQRQAPREVTARPISAPTSLTDAEWFCEGGGYRYPLCGWNVLLRGTKR